MNRLSIFYVLLIVKYFLESNKTYMSTQPIILLHSL